MVIGLLVCSDEDCTEVFEAVGTVEELLALACDCGCGLELIGWPESVEPGRTERLSVIPLPA